MTNLVKCCAICKQELPATLEYFHKAKSGRDGLKSMCKACTKIYNKEYQSSHRDQINATAKIWVEKNPDKHRATRIRGLESAKKKRLLNIDSERDQDRLYSREWRKRHPGYKAPSRGKWEQENPDKVRKVKSDWKKRNPEYSRLSRQKRRHRERELPFDFTPQDRDRAMGYFHGCSAVCGRQLKDLFGTHGAALDHWIPIAATNCPGAVPSNIIPLCHGVDGCNNSKGAKNAEEWLIAKFGKLKAATILKEIAAYFDYIRSMKR